MATEKKDNFFLIVGIIIAAAIGFVIYFAGVHSESVKYQAYDELQKEIKGQMQNK